MTSANLQYSGPIVAENLVLLSGKLIVIAIHRFLCVEDGGGQEEMGGGAAGTSQFSHHPWKAESSRV